MISISQNPFNSTPIYHIASEEFLSSNDNSFVEIVGSKNVAYCLGSPPSQSKIYIGPIRYETARTTLKNTNERIIANGGSFSSSLRVLPKMLRIASDVISDVDLRDGWLGYGAPEEDLQNYHILYSQVLDQGSIESEFISKTDDTKSFHRVLKCNNLLQTIKLRLIDDNLRALSFERHTICRLGLCIFPNDGQLQQ